MQYFFFPSLLTSNHLVVFFLAFPFFYPLIHPYLFHIYPFTLRFQEPVPNTFPSDLSQMIPNPYVKSIPSSCRIHPRSISLAICLALTLGPSTFAPFHSPSSLSPIADGAPALWTPLVDAFEKPGGFLGSLFKKTEMEQNTPPTTAPQENRQEVKEEVNDKVVTFSDEVLATAGDYGVVQLDLEGDPNCDYTTKVRIAGSEV